MKGKELIRHVVRGEMPDIEEVREKCVRQAAPREGRARRSLPRWAAMTAMVAAVICLLAGSLVWNSHNDNSFSVKAYSVETRADGSIGLREHERMREQEWISSWVVSHDGYAYGEIHLKCEGKNIKSVEFIAEEGGVLAREVRGLDNNISGSLVSHENSFLLTGDDLAENVLLHVRRPDLLDGIRPPVTILAIAIFMDGTTQEETLTVHIP